MSDEVKNAQVVTPGNGAVGRRVVEKTVTTVRTVYIEPCPVEAAQPTADVAVEQRKLSEKPEASETDVVDDGLAGDEDESAITHEQALQRARPNYPCPPRKRGR